MMNNNKSTPPEKIIMGIDPGTNYLGYGLLRIQSRKVEMLVMGVIDLHRVSDIYLKLGRIYDRIQSIIDDFLPDEVAIESPFFGKNVQSMLKLGRAQGVAIAAAMSRQVPIHEYAPLKIKQAITGNGQASKEQVAEMMKRMLHLREEQIPKFLDATDALAAAYCHYLQSQRPTALTSSPKSWKDFVRQNQNRTNLSTTPSNRTTVRTTKRMADEKNV